jgi:hypothetical protein
MSDYKDDFSKLQCDLNEIKNKLSEIIFESNLGFSDSKSFLKPLLRNQIEESIPKTTFINEKVDLAIEKVNNLNNEIHILKQEVFKTKRIIESIEVAPKHKFLETSSIHDSVKLIEENSSYTSDSFKRIFISTRNLLLAIGFGIAFNLVDSFFGNPIKNFFDSIKISGF